MRIKPTIKATVSATINGLETITYYHHHYCRKNGLKTAIKALILQALQAYKDQLVREIEELKKSAQITRVGGVFNGDTPVIIKDRDYHEKMNVIYATIDQAISIIRESKERT